MTLSRINKKTSQKESVRLEPHPPRTFPTALEARHWGATYALFRVRLSLGRLCEDISLSLQFANNLQLNRVLPPGPREYWAQLVDEQKRSPDHMKWMWEPDPFAARKADR